MPEGAGKPETREGVCAVCELTKPVAPCCTTHLIPICVECYGRSGSVDACLVPSMIDPPLNRPPERPLQHPLERVPNEEDTDLLHGWGQAAADDLPQPDWTVQGIQVIRAMMSEDGSEENAEPVGVLTLLLGREVHCPGHTPTALKGLNPEVLAQMPLEVRALIANIQPHEPHTEIYHQQFPVVVPMEMVRGMIEAMTAVRDNSFQEHHDKWMSEGLEQLLREGLKGETGDEDGE